MRQTTLNFKPVFKRVAEHERPLERIGQTQGNSGQVMLLSGPEVATNLIEDVHVSSANSEIIDNASLSSSVVLDESSTVIESDKAVVGVSQALKDSLSVAATHLRYIPSAADWFGHREKSPNTISQRLDPMVTAVMTLKGHASVTDPAMRVARNTDVGPALVEEHSGLASDDSVESDDDELPPRSTPAVRFHAPATSRP